MVFQSSALSLRGRQVVVRGAGHAGRMDKPRAAAWRPLDGNPSTYQFRGRVCLPTCRRHHSVVDGRPLLRSFLACGQTASGANGWKTMGRL